MIIISQGPVVTEYTISSNANKLHCATECIINVRSTILKTNSYFPQSNWKIGQLLDIPSSPCVAKA